MSNQMSHFVITFSPFEKICKVHHACLLIDPFELPSITACCASMFLIFLFDVVLEFTTFRRTVKT